MLLTTFSAEPYPFHKPQLQSNIILLLGLMQTVIPHFSGENGPGGPFVLEFWPPGPLFLLDQNFRDNVRQ